VKIFAWLYFKDRLSTRVNLYAKHVVDNEQCQRCRGSIEDRHHTFFGCSVNAGVWQQLGLDDVSTLSDEEVWSFAPLPRWMIDCGHSFFLQFSGDSGMQGTTKSSGENSATVE
jgi:hypothetical protein